MNTTAYKRWLTREIQALRDPQPDEPQAFYDAVSTIQEASRIAIDVDRPDIAAVLRKVKTPALALNVAQEVLSECRSMLTAAPSTDVLTPPQVAKRYRVSADTVRAWIATGILKATNVGKKTRPRYRVTTEALAEFDKKLPASVIPTVPSPRRKGSAKPDLIVTRFSSGRTANTGRGS